MHTRLGGHEVHIVGDFLHRKRRNASWLTLLPITAPTTRSNRKNEDAGNNISNQSESPKSPHWQSLARTHSHIMVNIVMLCRLMSLAQPLLKGISEISEILFLRSLRYYLWDLWDNISLLQLELWLFFSLDGIHIGYLADEGCLFSISLL